MKPIHFTNFTKENFTHKYDGRPFTIKSGESLYLPSEMARLFAKHLVNRELHKANLQVSDPKKHELVAKISPDLRFSDAKHRVEIIGDDMFLPAETTMEDRIALMNKKKGKKTEPQGVEDTASEVQSPEPTPELNAFDVHKASRPELEAEAIRLGCDKNEVKEAANKGVLKNMILEAPVSAEQVAQKKAEEEAKKKAEKGDEAKDEANDKPKEEEFED